MNVRMNSKLIAFRCPVILLEKLDEIALKIRKNRTEVFIEALQIFTRQVKRRGRKVIPSYSLSSMPPHYKILLEELKSQEEEAD